MNWPIFLAGILLGIIIGWILEWVVDLLFWRSRQKKWIAAESDYQNQLAESGNELENQKATISQLQAVQVGLASTQAETEELKRQLASVETQRSRLEAELTSVAAEKETLADRLDELTGLAANAPAAAGIGLLAMARGEQLDIDQLNQQAGDDLTMIEGIGPKIQELLNQNGIHTYTQLADSDVTQLQAVLEAGGSSFRLADPSSWPRQARLAAAHDWVKLQALKEQLTGGVRRPEEIGLAEPAPEDDLTMIEGIGPKIQELLNQNGIHTYTQLADSDVTQLQAVLEAGGSSFRLADPSSWPRQARLAAAHDWVKLQALKEQLTGGVRRPEEPAPEDDLTMIEGIGPKISASLKEHGIRTFTQLAHTDTATLHKILSESGPAFKLAGSAVESWPEQARLAAGGAWDELHALKDSLKAGRSDTQKLPDQP